jgi:hypothetical protein
MDAPEPDSKRLRRVAEHLEQLRKLDMVKSLGEHGQDIVVLQIFRYLQLSEIWEVISHSSALRVWLHEMRIWNTLARERLGKAMLDEVVDLLKGDLRSRLGINYFWILLAQECSIFKTEDGSFIKKEDDGINVLVDMIDTDDKVLDTMERVFPDGCRLTGEMTAPGISYDGQTVRLPVISMGPTYGPTQAEWVEFFYLILARGGSAVVEPPPTNLATRKEVLDAIYFKRVYRNMYGIETDEGLGVVAKFNLIRSELH